MKVRSRADGHRDHRAECEGRGALHQNQRKVALVERDADIAELIRVRGQVQGVGFRPTVWRLARRHGLSGWVGNDGAGVSIAVRGVAASIASFLTELRRSPPPLARIDSMERVPTAVTPDDGEFRIIASRTDEVRTGVAPDAATCPACRAEILDPGARRYRYPFANCTHCGPRLSIIEAIPYDRATTAMRAFRMCVDCAAEYTRPGGSPVSCAADRLRRVRPAPVACNRAPRRGPLDAARDLLLAGHIVAVKALGGFHTRLRCHQCGGGGAAAQDKAAGCKAVRADGTRYRRDPPLRAVSPEWPPARCKALPPRSW